MKNNLFALVIFWVLVIPGASAFKQHNASKDTKSSDKEVVVLLHGLARGKAAMWWLASELEDAGYNVVRVGYKSLRKQPDEILANVENQINGCCSKEKNIVHFVGHSLGGLLSRAYLQNNKVKNLGKVVLIGSPSNGTELVDYYKDRSWASLAGPTTLSLGTDAESFPCSLSAPYYPVGVIAGVTGDEDNDHILPGKDDGIVTVASTKIKGMTDFREVKVSHAMMRYNREVAELTVSFLKHGKFESTEETSK